MPKHKTIEEQLYEQILIIKKSGLLHRGWRSKIADIVNINREKKINPNHISQVLSKRSHDYEVLEAIVDYAENNHVKKLLEKTKKVVKKIQIESTDIAPLLFFFFFAFQSAFAQMPIDKSVYHTEPAFATRLQQYKAKLCNDYSIIDKYHVHVYPTRLRITEVESLLGYDKTPIRERVPIRTRVYYRPFEDKKTNNFYLALKSKTRMLSVSLIAKWEGEYFIEILDPQSPALVYYDTKSQVVEISYQ